MTAGDVDIARDLYDAMGYACRELAIVHDVLAQITAGVELEQLAGAVLEAARRVDRVLGMAATVRERYA